MSFLKLGDAVDGFSYKNLNKAFQLIMKTDCPLYSLGLGKFYREDNELTLDVGPFSKGTHLLKLSNWILTHEFQMNTLVQIQILHLRYLREGPA